MAKARKQKLKVFRTPASFDDAFVAAPSRKAALVAWGAGTDLFSAGIAEEVKDGEEAEAALARPGEVVRMRRGGEKEEEGGPRIKSGVTKNAEPERKHSGSKPSRAVVERAEAALAALEVKQSAERAALAKEQARLAKRGRELEERHARDRKKAEA